MANINRKNIFIPAFAVAVISLVINLIADWFRNTFESVWYYLGLALAVFAAIALFNWFREKRK